MFLTRPIRYVLLSLLKVVWLRTQVCGMTKQSKLVAGLGRMELTLTLSQVPEYFWGGFHGGGDANVDLIHFEERRLL